MSSPVYPPIAEAPIDSPFVCHVAKQPHSACAGEPFYKEHEGNRYCVLHFPAADKNPAFDSAIKKKLEAKDFNFEGIWFPRGQWFSGLDITEAANFRDAVFNESASFDKTVFRADVSFARAKFNSWTRFEHTTFIRKVDFSYARFQKEADFSNAKFEGYANFHHCTFNGRAEFYYALFRQTASFWPATFNSTASFSNVSFGRANFRASDFNEKAIFSWCAFGFTEFTDATFNNDADFFSARFDEKVYFTNAKFATSARFTMSEFNGETRFTSATFTTEADFSHAVFKDIVGFSAEYGKGGFGRNATCDLRHAHFGTPKQVYFHSMTLRPHWFINLDTREFQFIDVRWFGDLKRRFLHDEIGELRKREEREEKEAADKRAEYQRAAEQYDDKFTLERLQRDAREEGSVEAGDRVRKQTRFHRLLSLTCRQLAVNAEENHRYDEASRFRYWAMDARRLEAGRGFAFWKLSWWYWLASGYGERVFQAFIVLVGVWLVSALLYTQVGFTRWEPKLSSESDMAAAKRDEVGAPLSWPRALTYSVGVMTLQKPEPRPASIAAQTLVLVETILGPLQVALLALAIRRKFMR